MAVNLSPVGGVAAQFFTNTGAVLTGGKLFTYLAGTTTPAATYTSSSGNTAWTNPIVLDAAGRVPNSGEIWLTNAVVYKFVLKDSNDVLIATWDDVVYSTDSSQITYTPAGTGAVVTTVQAKLRETVSIQDYGNNLAVALTAIGAASQTLVINVPITLAGNTTIPANVSLLMEKGGSITTTGYTLTINGAFLAGPYQVFNGTGSVIFGAGAIDSARPEWWKSNDIPGTTPMQAGFQAAIDCLVASSMSTVKLASSRYYFSNYVELAANGTIIRLTGEGLASYGIANNAATVTGANGLSALFLISNPLVSLEVDHINFDGTAYNTGVAAALKFTTQTSPSRPINIHNCTFRNFAKAIHVVNVTGITYSGVSTLNILDNSFRLNGYALYAEGNYSAIQNLDFVGNNCEQNILGGIKSTDNAISAAITITDNMLEGQPGAIDISASAGVGIIERNYFEGNTGVIVRYVGSAGAPSIRMAHNYYSPAMVGTITLTNGYFDVESDFPPVGVTRTITLPSTNAVAWTPVITSTGPNPGVYELDSTTKCTYTRINGGTVLLQGYIKLASSITGGGSAQPLQIGNVPIPKGNNGLSALGSAAVANIDLTVGTVSLAIGFSDLSTSTNLYLYETKDNGALTFTNIAGLVAGSEIWFSITYSL